MNLIKISIMMKSKILEFYEIKKYRKQAAEQLTVRRYTMDNQIITIDEKK